MNRGPIIVAIDIEGRGPSPLRNGIVSIGLCALYMDGTLLDKMRWDLRPYPDQQMDPKCMMDFWSKQGNLLEKLQTHAVEPTLWHACFTCSIVCQCEKAQPHVSKQHNPKCVFVWAKRFRFWSTSE